MTKEYRSWVPEQSYLLPPSPMDWLPEGHLAYFVLELVGELDVSRIEEAIQSKDGRGTRPYSPRMMTALLLYAYCVGVFSSRKVERATYEDVAFRVLAGGAHPHFTTVNAFRLEHREALAGLFVQVLRLCSRAGLREQAAGQSERAELAPDAGESQRAATRAAKSRSQADALSGRPDDDDDGSGGGAVSGLPSHQVPATRSGEPTDKAQRNFTDPDSRIMVRNGVFLQAYNAQAAVSESQLVVAHAVTNQPPDTQHLVPMMERVRETCGSFPELLSADSGYVSEANITYCAAHGIDAYLAVRRKGDDNASLGRLPMTQARELQWEMHQKVSTPRGRAIYGRRKVIVEPVFGQIKQAMGFRRFSLRGLGKVAAEWAIVCLCHNLLKLRRTLGVLRLSAVAA